MWRPFCPPCWCRCWRACLFPFCFFLLLRSSPILHLALIGLVAFFMAHVANHSLSFIKLLHSLDGVILMKLDLLCLAFHSSQVLDEASYFLLELLILLCNLLCACIYTTFLTQTWLHKDESKHKSLQEVDASFLIMSFF